MKIYCIVEILKINYAFKSEYEISFICEEKDDVYLKFHEYMDKQIIQANEDSENYKKFLNEEKDVEAKIFDKKDYEIF